MTILYIVSSLLAILSFSIGHFMSGVAFLAIAAVAAHRWWDRRLRG